jgi:hypothetical protein
VNGQVRTPNSHSFEASVKEVIVNYATAPTAYRPSKNKTITVNTNRVAAPGINDGNITTSVPLIILPVIVLNIMKQDVFAGR